MPLRGLGRTAVLAVGLALVGCLQAPTGVPLGRDTGAAGEVLIGFQPQSSEAERTALRQKYGVLHVERLMDGLERWSAPGLSAASIAAEPGLKFAQRNHRRQIQGFPVPSDADYGKQWHLQPTYSNFPAAWDNALFSSTATPGAGVVVAVIDSGVDVTHPDLAGNIARNADGSVASLDEVGDDTYNGRNFKGTDGNGHGTHVSGILGAIANNNPTFSQNPQGNVVGAAPGVTILPVKTMRFDGGGDDFTIAKGIRDAVDWRGQGGIRARIINLSIGGPEPSPLLAEVMAYAHAQGVLMVIASGNDGGRVNYPAAYAGVIAVGATTPHNLKASYTSHGPQLAIVAPGGANPGRPEESKNGMRGIFSTLPTHPYYYSMQAGSNFKPLNYGEFSGTSMATPQVTAAAALLIQQATAQGRALSPDQIRTRLLATVTDLGAAGFDSEYGFGMLNPAKALGWTTHDGTGNL